MGIAIDISRRDALAGGLSSTALLIAGRHAMAAAPLSLRMVIERHTHARGGSRVLDGVHSMASDMEISEKGQVLTARYVATIEPRMRIDVQSAGVRAWSEGLDEAGAWEQPGDLAHARAATPEAGATLRRGVAFNLVGLHAFPRSGHKLSLAGRETVAGTPYAVVRVDMADGFRAFLYINRDSWMIERRRDFRALHPAFDASRKWLEDVYEDFLEVKGVKIPFGSHQVDVQTGAVLQRTRFSAIALNPDVPVGAFQRP